MPELPMLKPHKPELPAPEPPAPEPHAFELPAPELPAFKLLPAELGPALLAALAAISTTSAIGSLAFSSLALRCSHVTEPPPPPMLCETESIMISMSASLGRARSVERISVCRRLCLATRALMFGLSSSTASRKEVFIPERARVCRTPA